MTERLSDPSSWNERYQQGTTGWDLGAPAVALTQLLATLPRRALRVLVPGAGRGHDAIAWAQHGAQVTAFDFAPVAVAGMSENAARAGVTLDALELDLFALPSSMHASFDLVWEQTCLCAIDPARRGEYVAAMQRVLAPGGTLYALLWNHQREGGPPFDLPRALTHALFSSSFDVARVDTVQGSSRPGEYLMTMKKR